LFPDAQFPMSLLSQSSADTVGQYLQEISRYPLLTPDQEILYGRQVQHLVELQVQREVLISQLGQSINDLEWAEAVGLEPSQLRSIVHDGKRAKQRLIESNLRFVVSIAKRYQHLNLEMMDLLQEGSVGLQQAAERFDPTKGYRFSTYAYWLIWRAITHAISDQSRTIRLSSHMAERLFKIKRAQRELSAQLGRKGTIEEIAESLALKPIQVRDCLYYSRQPLSLDVNIGDEHKVALSELLEDHSPTPEDYVTLSCMQVSLESWILKLTPQQQQIIRLYYGFEGEKPMTFSKIAKTLKLTKGRVMRIQYNAIKKLRILACQENSE
jgi:RNA polymerase nonessential primary-like sigma factor